MTLPSADTRTKTPGVTSRAAEPSDELVVRVDTRGVMRTALIAAAIASVVLFWIPTLIVLLRHEPTYFKGGIALTAAIATVVLVLLCAGGVLLWLRSGARRNPVLTADSDGVHIAGRPPRRLDAQWDDLVLVTAVGRRAPVLAFYPKPQEDPEHEHDEQPGVDLSEPEHLRPLDFEKSPPPAMALPTQQQWDSIKPLPEEEPRDEAPAKKPKEPAGAALHGTPHVVSLEGTTPPAREVLMAIRRLSNGRVALD